MRPFLPLLSSLRWVSEPSGRLLSVFLGPAAGRERGAEGTKGLMKSNTWNTYDNSAPSHKTSYEANASAFPGRWGRNNV
eukprot:5286478-Pyramimonas_sp.AAC.1